MKNYKVNIVNEKILFKYEKTHSQQGKNSSYDMNI